MFAVIVMVLPRRGFGCGEIDSVCATLLQRLTHLMLCPVLCIDNAVCLYVRVRREQQLTVAQRAVSGTVHAYHYVVCRTGNLALTEDEGHAHFHVCCAVHTARVRLVHKFPHTEPSAATAPRLSRTPTSPGPRNSHSCT